MGQKPQLAEPRGSGRSTPFFLSCLDSVRLVVASRQPVFKHPMRKIGTASRVFPNRTGYSEDEEMETCLLPLGAAKKKGVGLPD